MNKVNSVYRDGYMVLAVEEVAYVQHFCYYYRKNHIHIETWAVARASRISRYGCNLIAGDSFPYHFLCGFSSSEKPT